MIKTHNVHGFRILTLDEFERIIVPQVKENPGAIIKFDVDENKYTECNVRIYVTCDGDSYRSHYLSPKTAVALHDHLKEVQKNG